MTVDPNLTLLDEPTPTLWERDDSADESPRGGWRIVLAVLVAAALPIEIAWLARHRDPWAETRQAIAALNEADRAALAADWERFQKLTPDEQRRLRELHEAIEQDTDPNALRATLTDYEKWKSGLSPQQSATLVGLTPQARVERLRTLADEQSSLAARSLSPADVKTLISWLEGVVDSYQEKLITLLPEPARQRLESLGRRERNIALILAAISQRGGVGPRFENLPPDALVELHGRLSPEAQRAWDSARTIEERKLLLAEWIRQAAIKTYGNRDGLSPMQRISNLELQKFFETELNEAERNRLFALPREEMTMQLKQEFLRRRGLLKEPPSGGAPNGYRPPGGKPGNPGEKGPFTPPNFGGDRRFDGTPKPKP